jgi:hypothetical protein
MDLVKNCRVHPTHCLISTQAGYAPGTNATHHLAIQKKAKSNLSVAFGRTSSALLDSARRPRPDPEDGSNGSSRTTPTPRQLDP